MRSAPETLSPLPGWIKPWLAALPALYFLSPLALLGLFALRNLPRPVLWLLIFYALSQLLPALLTPEPLLALALASLRTLLLFGLLGLGQRLQTPKQLRPALIGLSAVYLTALLFSSLQGVDLLTTRLTHPYMTSITLGLVSAYGIWLCIFLPGRWLWRLPIGLLALTVLLLSGSRGPLLVMGIGLLTGFLVNQGRKWLVGTLLAGAIILAGGVSFLGQRTQLAALNRLEQLDLTGRQFIWQNTLSIIQNAPLSGVGSYRLGHSLASPSECYTFTRPNERNACPAWARALGQPWLIAHNATLQQWAETGPLGTLGLFLLLGAALWISVTRRDPLASAFLTGVLLLNVTDNTLLVPGPFIGEMFWIVVGLQLRQFRLPDLGGAGMTGAGLLLLLSIPIIAMSLPGRNEQAVSLQLQFFAADPHPARADPYGIVAQFKGRPGRYTVSFNTCFEGCRALQTAALTVQDNRGVLAVPDLKLSPIPEQRVELRIYPAEGITLRPIATYSWPVSLTSIAAADPD
ncbi:O-antigen ligase family protein [Deinococcus maricopensis]|uniref:O-antigen polymerase n=1 Tax=Deinococcus maricopensis (strain DSM 21211 / LMG 22137 / NRRL B-23946 / LB-34) TaxID=709986 RepID=E8U3I5_DEIML|nr:O-antigen ligase family protein [Deinococcus maricopensis]ADV68609.1 O-antigen polymerase [Deinococcus maricopensis DSM 21211]